jgi:glycosyltransferase involved in cell wall biosynthesis
MNNKIGVGVITCNREEFFKNCINSIPAVDKLVVVNDGQPYSKEAYPSKVTELIQHEKNKCVGISKNEAMRYLMQNDCQHLFIIEDDMLIKKPDVFEQYLKAASVTGIWHLNFAYHGPANKDQNGNKRPRQVVDYGNGIEIALNPNIVGSFSYYLRGVIKAVGYMDERLKNCWEHVLHTHKIAQLGLHPPFWWFADLANSDDYIAEQACSEVNSVIRKTPEWQKNMREGMELYKYLMGDYPTKTMDTPPDRVLQILEQIRKNYAKAL